MAQGRILPHHGDALVLRTWPFHEADLLITLFTRDQGRIKGVARHALRSRKRFGGALEPGTLVRAHYTERPRQDLVRLDSFEILWSPLSAPVDWRRTAALQFVVEVLDEALPELAPEDNVFRLAVAVLLALDAAEPATLYLGLTYFAVWINRLMGWWPDLGHCAVCGIPLGGTDAFWSPSADGVTCPDDLRPASRPLPPAAIAQSHAIARQALPAFLSRTADSTPPGGWSADSAAALFHDLGAFAIALLERHLERRLRSAAPLATRLPECLTG